MIDVTNPVGSMQDRAIGKVWAGNYFDATGFAYRYRRGTPAEAYHTGADLNCNYPIWDSDKDAPIWSIAPGEVVSVGTYKVWGRIAIICHDDNNGGHYYARYAHFNNPSIRAGERVITGQQIATIGNANGAQPYHLHFDISPTEVLADRPDDWCKLDLRRLLRDYADPKAWLEARIAHIGKPTRLVEVTVKTLYVRLAPSTRAAKIGEYKKGAIVRLVNTAPIAANGEKWQQIADNDGNGTGKWIAIAYTVAADQL